MVSSKIALYLSDDAPAVILDEAADARSTDPHPGGTKTECIGP